MNTVIVNFLPMRGAEVFLILPVIAFGFKLLSGNTQPEKLSIIPTSEPKRNYSRPQSYRLRLVPAKGIDPHSYDPLDSAREVQA